MQGVSGFLKVRAPLWHQVGRVCFHLAENRRDPEYPFAFLATYAPGLTGGARVQYRPLSKALQEYAGAKDKKALVKLLSPVHLASQTSSFVKELVDSGDVYQPLAWTPQQAYRFLKEVPVFEQSGVLVRLPDWWKRRPRPRVSVTIGSNRQKKFDSTAMLDFQVQFALGDETLTEAEWRELLAAEEGLVLLRGQWVEVDREKLTEALGHWKKVEAEAADGLSFIEGMRLLAGALRDLDDGGDQGEAAREWSFVRAGEWLGEVLSGLRSPENLERAKPGAELKGDLAGVPGNRRRLAMVHVEPGAGRLPGGRHGAGQDDPGADSAAHPEETARRQAVAPGLAGVPVGELEVGDGPLHPDAPRQVRPSLGNVQGSA